MKKFWSILGSIFLIFAVIILIFCIYIAVKSKQTGEDIYILGYKPYIISTGSMEPTLKVRALVIIKQVPYEDIKADDIISFVPEEIGKSVCHRVVEIDEEGIVTKGDNNFTADMGKVSKEEYKGKLILSSNIYANIYYAVTEGNPVIVIGLFLLLIFGIIIAVIAIKFLRKELATEEPEKILREEPKKGHGPGRRSK